MANKQLGFYVNTSNCTGCKTCQIACKDKNNCEVGRRFRRVVEVSGGEWVKRGNVWIDNSHTYNLSTACQHCTAPECMRVCPTKAITKREADGIVLIDPNLCIGCRYCEWACPYGAPQYDAAQNVMTKCDFCVDYIDQGKNPACVDACPTRVIEFGDIEELRAKYGTVDNIYPLPDPSITQPNLVLKPHRQAIIGSSAPAKIGNEEEI